MTTALGNWAACAALLLAFQSQAAATWQQVPIPGVPTGTFITWLGIDPIGNINLTLAQNSMRKGPDPTLLRALFRSVDGGQTWAQTNLPSNVSMLLAVDPTAPNIIYGISRSGFFRSTDSGATFGDTGNVGILEIGADPQAAGAAERLNGNNIVLL